MARFKNDADNEQKVDKKAEAVETPTVETPAAVDSKAVEPTDAVKPVLKIFKNIEELYVSDKGCVFMADTPEAQRGNAVLYKNPYFNQ